MKRYFPVILVIFGLINYSCEENFSPKGDYQEKYILTCVIRGDTSFQTASISKSYDVPGYDAGLNRTDPFIKTALIRIWQGDSVKFMRDTSIVRTDTSRYNSPFHYFYLDNFKPDNEKELEIEAILKNGKILRGFTKIPESIEWVISDTSSSQIPAQADSHFYFSWSSSLNLGWYIPRFSFFYLKNENGVQVLNKKEVPLKYVYEGGKLVPKFSMPIRNNSVGIPNAYLDSAFTQISRGDANKANYTILGCIFELLVLDENLSKYYSTLHGFLDDYTIRIDESDFTNIEGGLGVFGSYLKQQEGGFINKDYINSFGYISGLQ